MVGKTSQSPRQIDAPPAPTPEVLEICASFGNDRHRMMDILHAVQDRYRWIAPETMETIAEATGLSRIQVEGVASFYSFFSLTPKGRVTIRLCDDIIDRYAGLEAVTAAFESELGISVGETSLDGAFSLEYTPCIGMCDQAPAAMINDVVVTQLTPQKAREVARALKAGESPEKIAVPGFTPSRRMSGRRAWSTTTSAMPARSCSARCRWMPASRRRSSITPTQIIEHDRGKRLAWLRRRRFRHRPKWQFAAGGEPTSASSSATPTKASPAPSRTGCC